MRPYTFAARELEHNPGQIEAYNSVDNTVILAGPGSGKTKTITLKIARILNEDIRPPRGVACLTYNHESARELKLRLSKLGIHDNPRVYVGTIHSFCLQHLLLPFGELAGLDLPQPVAVADAQTSSRIFADVMRTIEPFAFENPRRIRNRMDRYRRTNLDRNQAEWFANNDLVDLVEAYEGQLRREGMIDFDDMIILGLSLLKNNVWVRKITEAKFPVLVVDEYQDLGTALHEIVLSLAIEGGVRIIAVGDPDQSIYDFTGANPNLLLQLAERPEVRKIRLSLNYRNAAKIVKSSLVVLDETRDYEPAQTNEGLITIRHLPEGIEEQAETVCKELIPQTLANRAGRRLGDIAILYPDRNDAAVMTKVARRHGYKYIGGDKQLRYSPSPVTFWLEDCAAWCSGGWKEAQPRLSSLLYFWSVYASRNNRFEVSIDLRAKFTQFLMLHRSPEILLKQWLDDLLDLDFRQILESTRGRPGELDSFNSLYEAASDEDRMGEMTVGAFGGLRGASDHLRLLTLHSSKGLEFDTVFMIGLENGKIPNFQAVSPEALREQRRLFYVGLTRARHEVYLLSSGFSENAYGKRFYNGPSPFIGEVESNLLT